MNRDVTGTTLAALSHRIPWNGMFWVVTAVLLLGAAGFSVGIHMQRRGRLVAKTAEIVDGDTVKVVFIHNGDEIEVAKSGGRASVRMLGIRSFDPVINEREITAWGHASVGFLKQWVLNKQVKLVFDDPIKDVRGRYLAYVEYDDIDVNQMMVEKGISMVYTEYPFARELAYLHTESLARRGPQGIWGGKKAVDRINALRLDWAAARRDRTGKPPPDYLLGEIQ